jgi:tRNA threonylcarbamoyladenosine biosynthesis protein TsaE
MKVELTTVDDTVEFGRRLAAILRAGDLVILDGPLGAGKTALTRGVGLGLGVRGAVTSPTFVISRVHPGGRVPLVHVDAYRLGGVSEVDDLDLDASLDESVTVVEWGGGKVEQLTDAHLLVRITRRDDDARLVELVPAGADWPDRLSDLSPPSN